MPLAKRYWFRAKHYGWGWYPATKEGWMITLLFIALIILLASQRERFQSTTQYFIILGLTVACLIVICYKTGEKPEWRWGK